MKSNRAVKILIIPLSMETARISKMISTKLSYKKKFNDFSEYQSLNEKMIKLKHEPKISLLILILMV